MFAGFGIYKIAFVYSSLCQQYLSNSVLQKPDDIVLYLTLAGENEETLKLDNLKNAMKT